MMRIQVLGLIVCMTALGTLPFWTGAYGTVVASLALVYLAMAQMWNLLAGYCRLISLGQQMFVGLGGYALATLSVYYGLPLWLSILAGGLVSVTFALLLSCWLFRMSGAYFAVATWVVAEVLGLCFGNWSFVKYGMGMFIQPAYSVSVNQIYYAALAVGVASIALMFGLLRSEVGLGLLAIRDDEEAARSVGVHVFRCRLWCFLLAAFVTGIASGVLYLHLVFIQPYKAFSIDWTVKFLFIAIIGGIGTIEGPILGAVIFVGLQQLFSEWPTISMLLLGIFAVTTMLVAPDGIMGVLKKR
jgi:branched-chain amino acid transport system permease protein